ncbi:hypothetical protein, partial [Klebsiella quasipneumoniae]|uniref:hypothetical protein n=1 Tax=Klebsiella quasipneumoniae TaxID=1463165 RepID=UPI003EBA2945
HFALKQRIYRSPVAIQAAQFCSAQYYIPNYINAGWCYFCCECFWVNNKRYSIAVSEKRTDVYL